MGAPAVTGREHTERVAHRTSSMAVVACPLLDRGSPELLRVLSTLGPTSHGDGSRRLSPRNGTTPILQLK